jgi:hypothetical protein
MKDIAMAQQASVSDVWAAYGAPTERPEYELLRAVTHWSDKAVQSEKMLTRETISPNNVLRHAFEEILPLFEFIPYHSATRSFLSTAVVMSNWG